MARRFTGRRLLALGVWIGLSASLGSACGGTTIDGFGTGGSASGCQKDTDCKGARICVGGMCVNPGAGGSGPSGPSGSAVTTTSSSMAGTTSTSGTGAGSTTSTTSTTGSGGSSTTTASSTSGTGGSSTASTTSTSGSGGGSTTTASSTSGTGAGSTASTTSTSASSTGSTTSASSTSGGSCTAGDPNADQDGDGWTPAQGDCNDCDPTVNPGAVDVPGDPSQVDHDCDGKYDPPVPCDGALALDDVNPADAAKAIELCRTTTAGPQPPQKTWGVINAQYVHANGSAFATPSLQVGVQTTFGTNVNPQGGQSMLALSSGHARTPTQTGTCGSNSCTNNANPDVAPSGFPQPIQGCPATATIYDDIGLQVDIRTPTNATGYAFDFKFYSMEFPYWVCDSYIDELVVLASPAPAGAINGNIAFDSLKNPVSTMLGFMSVCDPTQSGVYATDCMTSGTGTCPMPPNPYCPNGTAQLQGTGFDVWDTSYGGAGATPWLTTQAPVQGGSELTLRFTMWDGGDTNFDSTSLIDDFHWIFDVVVPVETAPTTNPK